MSPGYERAALRLSGLPGDDRDWILAHLAEADRLRINELIERDKRVLASKPRESGEPQQTRETTVANASAVEIAKVLREEPDWLVALILARRRWTWDSDYLGGVEPTRLERLREIARAVRGAARPCARDEAVVALAEKLERLPAAPEPRTAFDDLLERMLAWRAPASEGRNRT